MSGTQELNAEERLKHVNDLLDKYEYSVGLPKYEANEEVDSELAEYLNYSRDTLEQLTADECSYAAYIMSKYAFNLQRAQNRENAIVGWAKQTIKHVIADEVNNYKGYAYDERAAQAIKKNSFAFKVQQIMVYAEQRSNRLNFLSKSLQNMAEFIRSIQFNKVKNE